MLLMRCFAWASVGEAGRGARCAFQFWVTDMLHPDLVVCIVTAAQAVKVPPDAISCVVAEYMRAWLLDGAGDWSRTRAALQVAVSLKTTDAVCSVEFSVRNGQIVPADTTPPPSDSGVEEGAPVQLPASLTALLHAMQPQGVSPAWSLCAIGALLRRCRDATLASASAWLHGSDALSTLCQGPCFDVLQFAVATAAPLVSCPDDDARGELQSLPPPVFALVVRHASADATMKCAVVEQYLAACGGDGCATVLTLPDLTSVLVCARDAAVALGLIPATALGAGAAGGGTAGLFATVGSAPTTGMTTGRAAVPTRLCVVGPFVWLGEPLLNDVGL